MEKAKGYLLLLLTFIAAGIYAQTAIEPTFISVGNKYEFTLPQFDVRSR